MAYEQAAVDLGIHDDEESAKRALLHTASNDPREDLFAGNRSHGMVNPTVSQPYNSPLSKDLEKGTMPLQPSEFQAIEEMEGTKKVWSKNRDRDAAIAPIALGIRNSS
jgi:hypothetical protein